MNLRKGNSGSVRASDSLRGQGLESHGTQQACCHAWHLVYPEISFRHDRHELWNSIYWYKSLLSFCLKSTCGGSLAIFGIDRQRLSLRRYVPAQPRSGALARTMWKFTIEWFAIR